MFRTVAFNLVGLALAAGFLTPAPAEGPKKLLLMAGTPSHGPGEHEFNAGVLLLAQCLESVENLEVVVQLNGWPEDESKFEGVDGILLYMDGGARHPAVQPGRLEFLGNLMDQGVGLMCAHYGVEVPAENGGAEFKRWIGGYYETAFSCNPMWSPDYANLPDHPIAKGVRGFQIRDEWYMNMRFREDMSGVAELLVATPPDEVRDGPYVYPKGPYEHIQAEKGEPETMMWAVERPDGGRGVGFTGGHFHKNWGDDNFRKAVLNALVWITGMDVPEGGVESVVTEDDLAKNLDPKG
ncbi:MAG: ThuA domain-containing protein [Candidatus Hydrogenedentes bacterium]|nr:ThuA domain-containing protein [Candidatus Hydrogenedentota bacterium]